MRVLLTQLHREKYSSHDSTGLFSPFPPMTLCCGCVSVLCHSETVIKRWTLSANESHSKFVCQHGNFSKIFLSPTEIFPKTFCFSGSHLPPLLCGNGTFFSCFANRNLVFQKLTLIFFFFVLVFVETGKHFSCGDDVRLEVLQVVFLISSQKSSRFNTSYALNICRIMTTGSDLQ